MKPIIIAVCLLASALSASAAVVATNAPPTDKKRYIVTLKDDASPDAFAARRNFKMRKLTRTARNGFTANLAGDEALVLPGLNMVICDLESVEAESARKESDVLAVEADGPMTLCDQINPFGITRMGIDHFPVAHINQTNEPLDVDVAIVDSGIDPHEDMDAVVDTFFTFGIDGSDALGHGTSVAGVVAARDNGLGDAMGIRVFGVAPGVRIWNVKVIGPPPDNSWTFLISGLGYILENADKISVANVSINNTATGAPVNSLRLGVRRLVNAGVVVVVSAGNQNQDIAGPDGIYGTGDDSVPAALAETMAVSAMDSTIYSLGAQPRDQFWIDTPGAIGSNFSQIERTNIPSGATVANYVFSPGGAIDVAGPGVNIATTASGIGSGGVSHNYGILTGTSMAAPHVTGLVALYIAANGRATNAEGVYRIRQAIIDASLPQSQWNTNNTLDPDTNPEPLAIASEAWVPKPAITNFAGAPGNFQVSFTTVPGYDYIVQATTNLTSWTNLVTVSGGSNAVPASVIDSNIVSQNFYRLSRTPSP